MVIESTGCGQHGYSIASLPFLLQVRDTENVTFKNFPKVAPLHFLFRFVVSVYYSLAVEKKKRRTLSVN